LPEMTYFPMLLPVQHDKQSTVWFGFPVTIQEADTAR
jgi:hypothetical protein